jgi:hypothetical protein
MPATITNQTNSVEPRRRNRELVSATPHKAFGEFNAPTSGRIIRINPNLTEAESRELTLATIQKVRDSFPEVEAQYRAELAASRSHAIHA